MHVFAAKTAQNRAAAFLRQRRIERVTRFETPRNGQSLEKKQICALPARAIDRSKN